MKKKTLVFRDRSSTLIKSDLNIKGIVSDSSKIILWHESEDINKKSLFPKFQLLPILRFQVMHDYV